MVDQETANADLQGRFRRQMPVAALWAYLDHAAVAPLSGPAQKAIAGWAREAAEEGATDWSAWTHRVEETRRRAARLIGSAAAEIALVPNTTSGISLVAEGYPWLSGDNVVTLADEFPSNQYPWMNLAGRGVETRRVSTDEGRLDLAKLDEACDERTRIVAISWVGYATGYRHDLGAVAQIAHHHGALVCLDAIQGLGVFPLDVGQTAIDFLAADGHKWLLGPEGAGVLYVRGEHLERLRPLGVGWNSVVHSHDFRHIELKLKPSAERYEGGSQNMVGMLALGASLEMLLGYGIDQIAEQILKITDQACERLAQIGAQIVSVREGERRSSIVSFELAGHDPALVRRHCLAQRVLLSCRGGRLRISPHAYNNEDDLDRLIAALESAPTG